MSLISSRKTRVSQPVRRRPSSFRPRLEALEDRCLLSAPPSAGTPDPTFGSGAGYVTSSNSTTADPSGDYVLIQPSGTIIVGGLTTITVQGNPNPVPASELDAYNPDGSVDTAFGSGGIVRQPFAGNAGGYAECAALEPMGAGDDKILLAGKVNGQGGLAIMRLNANGTLDTTFGSNGQVVTLIQTSGSTDVSEVARAVAVTSSGQILVAGQDGSGSVVMAQYSSNGTLDTSFGSGGTTTFHAGTDYANSVAVESDGQFVLAGTQIVPVASGTAPREGLLLRYNANGSLDSSFGNGGIVTTEIPSAYGTYFKGVAINPSTGQIIVAADVETNYNPQTGNVDNLWAAARYNANGSLDTTFGIGGSLIIPDAQETNPNDDPWAVALQSDGKVILVGESFADTSNGFPSSARVVRLSVNGSLDASFGNDGLVTTVVGSEDNFTAVVIQPNGDIVAVGSAYIDSAYEFLVARYLAAPTPSFAVTGPLDLIAGTTGTFTITALNADGTTNSSYSGTATVTSTDPNAILPGPVTISGGTGAFNVTLETAGTQSVTATDTSSGITGGDTAGVSPAEASQIVLTQELASGTAGQALGTVQATIEDAYGNVETGDNSDGVTLSVNSGPSTQMGGTLTQTFVAGIASFSSTPR